VGSLRLDAGVIGVPGSWCCNLQWEPSDSRDIILSSATAGCCWSDCTSATHPRLSRQSLWLFGKPCRDKESWTVQCGHRRAKWLVPGRLSMTHPASTCTWCHGVCVISYSTCGNVCCCVTEGSSSKQQQRLHGWVKSLKWRDICSQNCQWLTDAMAEGTRPCVKWCLDHAYSFWQSLVPFSTCHCSSILQY
jgi:hypothetical protein